MSSTLTATFVITDLVDSTAIASSLSPEEAEALRVNHFSLLRSAIEGCGGIEVKSLGDGLMVLFTSPSRAVTCAVAMQQALERHNRRAAVPLAMRVGLSTGEVNEDGGDYYGDAVIEAVRLCGTAQGGQILASDVVRVLAGRHATQEFTDLGPVELKGLPRPVPAVEVVWAPLPDAERDGGDRPLPAPVARAATQTLFAFCGRHDELDQLASALKRAAADGQLHVAMIGGEPGVGKTALAAHAARAAHGGGALVVYGSSEEGLAVPYQPWIGALSALVEQASPELLAAHVEGHGTVLGRLAPAIARRLPSGPPLRTGDPETERYRLMEAVGGLLALVSAETALVVVLDDLHWADVASLQVLRHLITAGGSLRVLVMGTYRDTDLSHEHPLNELLSDLRRRAGSVRLRLDGLADLELLELMETAAGHALPEAGVALAHALRRETGGNPFFAAEILRHLAETGAFVLDASGRYALRTELQALDLPNSVRDVVAGRVARLGAEAVRVLSLASVIGQEFEVAVLARVVETSEDQLLDVLDHAAAVALIAESDGAAARYRFVHALIQHTLYQDLSHARRRRAHERIAQVMETDARPDALRIAELARHWLAATQPADVGKALHYAKLAGDAALEALAPADAVRWYSQALDLFTRHSEPDEHERCALLVGLGQAQCHAGQSAFRETLLEAAALAQRLGDTDHLVAAALANTRGYSTFVAADPERLAVLSAALAAVGETDSDVRARLLAVKAGQTDPFDWAEARSVALEAIAVARRLGDKATLLSVLTQTYAARGQPDALPQRLADTAEELALADEIGDPVARLLARFNRVHACLEAGDIVEVDERLNDMAVIVEATSLPYLRVLLLLSRHWRLLLAGRTDDAEAAANEVLDLGNRIGLAETFGLYGAQLFRIRHEQGRLNEIVEFFAQAAADNPTLPSLRASLTDLYCQLGRYDDARQLFRHDAGNEFADFAFDLVWLTGIVRCADNAATLGDERAAASLYARLSPFSHMIAANPATLAGAVARPLGRLAALLGHSDEAEMLLRRALATHERLNAPYWTALTLLDLADLLRSRANPSDGREAADAVAHAQEIAVARGYAGLRRRVDALASPD